MLYWSRSREAPCCHRHGVSGPPRRRGCARLEGAAVEAMRARLNLFCATLYAIVVVLAVAMTAHGAEQPSRPVPLVICDVFGRYCNQALAVSYCESRWHTDARNGQYRGLFQMGARERRLYGHGADALSQTRAAWRYFRATGKDWSPWSCRWAA